MRKMTSLLVLVSAVLVQWQGPLPSTPTSGQLETQQPQGQKRQDQKLQSQEPQSQRSQDQRPQDQRPQDPKPQGQRPTSKPTGKPGNTQRKVIGKPKRNLLEGVYKLRSRVVRGLAGKQSNRGYLVVTSRHMFLSLASPGTSDEHPLVHSSVREWRKTEDGVRMTCKLDYFSSDSGVITMTPAGKQDVRRIQIIRGGLRVIQGKQTWLEFERVE